MAHLDNSNRGPRFKDMAGCRFGMLNVIREAGRSKHGSALWECACDCGRTTIVVGQHIRNGKAQSCGCLKKTNAVKVGMKNKKHGHNVNGRSATYQSWRAMKDRCASARNKDWRHYGGRGIAVCKRWSKFANFLADMGVRPHGRTLDRVDVDGNYEPGNCRWATVKEQRHNRRQPPAEATVRGREVEG